MATYTEQELAGLSEAERAAVIELEQDEAINAERHSTGDTDDRRRLKGEEDPAPKTEPVENNDPAHDPDPEKVAKVDPPAAAVVAEEVLDTTKAESAKPLFDAKPVEDFEKKLADIKAAKAEVTRKVEEGDLTYGEADAEREKLNDQEYALRRDQDRYELSESTRQQQEKNSWERDCNSFMDAHPEYGASKLRFQAINSLVVEMANDPANVGMTGQQLLNKAHETVVADLGVAPGAKNPPVAPKVPNKGVPIPEMTGIGKIPAAEANDISENRFAHLDRLKGLELEDALAKMPKADYDAYMKQ